MTVIGTSCSRTASEGRATVGKKPGDAPRAARRSALGYLIMPLRGGGNEKNRSLGKNRPNHPIRLMFLIDLIRPATRLG